MNLKQKTILEIVERIETDDEFAGKVGDQIIDNLHLPAAQGYADRFIITGWGTYTKIGVARCTLRMLLEDSVKFLK